MASNHNITPIQATHHTMLPAHKRLGKDVSRPVAVLLLAFVLCSSFISVMGARIGFFDSIAGNVINGLSMTSLIVISYFFKKQFSLANLGYQFKAAGILLCMVVLILAFYGYGSPNVHKSLKMSVAFKSVGILLTIASLAIGSTVFTKRELISGLILFAVVELTGCLVLYFINADVNPNSLSVRACVAGMCCYALMERRLIAVAIFAACLVFSFFLQCRTSTIAMLGAVFVLAVERNSRQQRTITVIASIIGVIITLVYLPYLIIAIHNAAISALGSDNFLSQFFLSDKSVDRIRYDFLDRSDIWEYSWGIIKLRPLLGHGLGLEHAIMGVRSHNAFLSILVEGGVVLLLGWGAFYLSCALGLFSGKGIDWDSNDRVFNLAVMLLSYMLLAGIVESSGLASVSTPINLVFILLIIWLFGSKKNPSLITPGRVWVNSVN